MPSIAHATAQVRKTKPVKLVLEARNEQLEKKGKRLW